MHGAVWFNSFKSLKKEKWETFQLTAYILNVVIKKLNNLTSVEQPKNMKNQYTKMDMTHVNATIPKMLIVSNNISFHTV